MIFSIRPRIAKYLEKERKRVAKKVAVACRKIEEGDLSWWGDLLVDMLKTSLAKLWIDAFSWTGILTILSASIGLREWGPSIPPRFGLTMEIQNGGCPFIFLWSSSRKAEQDSINCTVRSRMALEVC